MIHSNRSKRSTRSRSGASKPSSSLLRRAAEARRARTRVWALTGPAPDPPHEHDDAAISVPGGVPVVPKLHPTLIHRLCAPVESLARGVITDLRSFARAAAGFRDKEERPWP